MKTTTLFFILFAAIIFIGCSNNTSNKSLLDDAKKAANLECRSQQITNDSQTGDVSFLDEDTRISEELSLLKKKYQTDELRSKFSDAVDKEMLNCDNVEVKVSENIDAEQVTNEDNGNWDKMLDDYELYVTDYVALYKRAIKGDNDAFLAYPELLEKAENLEKSMKEAEKNKQLTAAQLKRMTKIQVKMIEAMQSN